MSLCLNPNCSAANQDGHKFCEKCRSKLFLQERYQAIQLIGQGGFGRTFKAIDYSKPSRPYCVIKQFFPSAQGTDTIEKASELFEKEAIQLEKLGKHPQIPELFAYLNHDDNRQYLVQEYIEGQNLEQELKSQSVFNEAKIKALLTDILPVLDFIHSQGVVHRDIKPENIIRRNSDKKAVLVDFGASRVVTPLNRSVTGTVIGSAEYVAPEQANGKANNPSDLYSLGVTCIYLLTQVSPFDLFDTSDHEWVWRQFLVNNNVRDDLGRILDKMIEFGTRKRYQSAREILQDLTGQSPATSIQSPATPVIQIPAPPKVAANIVLKSARGVNYSRLQQLLAAGKWKEADQETSKVMLQVAGRQTEGWLRIEEDIDNFPCEDLRTINQLWLHYSNGKFGFSVQKEIYESLGGTRVYNERVWNKFCDRVGWRKRGKWLEYSDLTFNLREASPAHLPYCGCEEDLGIFSFLFHWDEWGEVGVFSSLAQRLVTCRI
ncbi:MAG: GUN4 domain-containing protein [Microcystis sp. M015S2]|uniref:GUN4 domain-containing protein n=1 Tax=unclassified Microcystis TaxID=2643300 RepID=UPI002587CAB8|nr:MULTISPECIES: GUN4 domain-containing protein [unclassified Microcystis]MCA2709046.1 GUN4 domain-containing protein [Microcystis sp. M025S2]MCA2741837.1 GUN4 domain-containing protein [Microcystis sp. M015S2]MCA2759738.1 GUN4 domain-containing protein [Microcystis sp. M145S2]